MCQADTHLGGDTSRVEKEVSSQNLGNGATLAQNQKHPTGCVGVRPHGWSSSCGSPAFMVLWPRRSLGLCFLTVVMAENLVPGSGNLSFWAPASIRNEGPMVWMWRISAGVGFSWNLGML